MEETRRRSDEEVDDLRQEIENFQKEKERVRLIVGQIGGMPTISVKIFNFIFFVFIIACFVVSLMSKGTLSLLMIDLGIAALAVKLIILMHYQSRVNHFQLWILSSIEWRLNELIKETKKIKENNSPATG
ncbi:MAG: hypothetical protein KKH94_02410 [Candidatus Omnitrophica bacterium]|nr:hypothetical protein [Candidatus Omnitrophota bacterium]